MGTARPEESDSVARPAADRFLAALVMAAPVVALVVAPTWFVFPFVATKVWFLRPLAWAMAAYLAGAVALRRTPLPRPGPVAWAGLAFLASAALSTAFGVDPARGVWDTGERMIGLVTLAAMAVCFVATVRIGRDAAAWTRLLRAALVAACLVAVGAVIEASGFRRSWMQDRTSSTLGSPAFLGAYGLHAVFLGLLVRARAPATGDRRLAAAAIVGGFACIVLSEARAAVVGLLLGGAYVVVRAAIDGTPRVRRTILTVAASVVAVAAVVVAARDSAIVQAVPLVRRLAAFYTGDATYSTRLLAWDTALDAARDAPLLGWGLNAFPHAFAAHFRPEMLRFGAAEVFFDDAHGIVFTTLAEQGLVGVAALTALFVAAFVALGRARASGALSGPACVAAGGWLVAHAGNLLLSFEDVSSLAAFALVLAFCESAGADPDVHAARVVVPTTRAGPLRATVAVACGVAALTWTVVADVRPAVANARARAAIDLVPRDPRSALERMSESLAFTSPHAETDANLFAWAVHEAVPDLVRSGRAAEADDAGRGAFDVLGRVARDGPPDVARVLLRASLAAATPSLRGDPSVQDAVFSELTRSVEAAPRRQDLRFALAAFEMRHGRFQSAADHVRAVVRDDPLSSWGWARLAVVYRESGRDDEARRIVAEARAHGVGFRAEDVTLLGDLAR